MYQAWLAGFRVGPGRVPAVSLGCNWMPAKHFFVPSQIPRHSSLSLSIPLCSLPRRRDLPMTPLCLSLPSFLHYTCVCFAKFALCAHPPPPTASIPSSPSNPFTDAQPIKHWNQLQVMLE